MSWMAATSAARAASENTWPSRTRKAGASSASVTRSLPVISTSATRYCRPRDTAKRTTSSSPCALRVNAAVASR